MNKENAMKKINSIGKAGTVISIIMQIILIVGMMAVLLAGIIVFCLPADLFEFRIESSGSVEFDMNGIPEKDLKAFSNENPAVNSGFSLNGINYKAVKTVVDGSRVITDLEGSSAAITPVWLRVIMVTAAVLLIITMVVMCFVKKLCQSIKDCSSPFEERVVKSLEHCAWALIPWVVVCSICKSVLGAATSGNANLTLNISLSTVLVILLIFGLTYIFKYGAELQTESDETL